MTHYEYRTIYRDDGIHLQRQIAVGDPFETLAIFEWSDRETKEKTERRAKEALFEERNATADIETQDLDPRP